MIEADRVLYSEFRNMMSARKAVSNSVPLIDFPIPPFRMEVNPSLRSVTAKGITEPYFSALNGKVLQVLPRTKLKKRRYLANGEFQKDAKGNVLTDDISVPNGSLAIISKVNIKLPNVINGKKHTPTRGFLYVDYRKGKTKEDTQYIYIIPREHLYELNVCSLSLSYNRKRSFYKGAKVALQNGSFLYVYVSPYRGRVSEDTRILLVKNSVNFDKEVDMLFRGWQSLKVMFNLTLTALEDQINGNRNLGIVLLEPTLSEDDFIPVSKTPLVTSNEDALDDIDL